MDKQYSETGALQLAGKLAQAAQRVFKANPLTLSSVLKSLDEALTKYDDYIVDWTNSEHK